MTDPLVNGKFFTNDGEYVIIECVEDLEQLVRDRIGFEAAQLVKELADKTNEVNFRLQSDLTSYEMQLESNRAAFEEIMSYTSSILKLMSGNLTQSAKKSIIERLYAIQKEVSNQL